MDDSGKNNRREEIRPACFGNEAKFMAHMEARDPGEECAECASENDCGEFILLKCSRELMY